MANYYNTDKCVVYNEATTPILTITATGTTNNLSYPLTLNYYMLGNMPVMDLFIDLGQITFTNTDSLNFSYSITISNDDFQILNNNNITTNSFKADIYGYSGMLKHNSYGTMDISIVDSKIVSSSDNSITYYLVVNLNGTPTTSSVFLYFYYISYKGFLHPTP